MGVQDYREGEYFAYLDADTEPGPTSVSESHQLPAPLPLQSVGTCNTETLCWHYSALLSTLQLQCTWD